ncbi:cytochrome P450 [Mycena polygramma]|nr:cytochrome P450 [Mycena polygramma]
MAPAIHGWSRGYRQQLLWLAPSQKTISQGYWWRRGEGNGSYVEQLIEKQDDFGMDREMTGYLSGVLIETGSETTSAYLQSLVLALVAYPDAQRKAQEEIDRVVGEHRMPTLDDLEHMPYIRAVTHRFRPMTPFGIPHCTLAAEEYKGYLIPKGSTIYINASVEGGIFHDPGKFLFDSPDFIPDRYLLTENGTKPGVDGSDLRPNFAFGTGRRICPGIHVAQHTIVCVIPFTGQLSHRVVQNLNVMNLLWAFNFNEDVDVEGNPIELDTMDYLPGLTSKPRSFKCRIAPRTAEKAEIIEREFLEATDTFSKFEFGLSAEDRAYVASSRV